MKRYYSDERNAQIMVALLKEYGIKRIIASPGTTNMAFVVSVHHDPYFEVYSAVDERSAAYMACGLAAESGQPVVLSCTGATASRNYMPGMTEAYYRKLPVLAVTSTQAVSKVGHHIAQIIDRSVIPNDVAKFSVVLPIIKDDDDVWECEIKVNQAIQELRRHGGGPVHINLPTTYDRNYSTEKLPSARVIRRISAFDKFPEMPKGKIAIFVGAHRAWTDRQVELLEKFCAANNAVVFCDHSSNYKGKYRVIYSLAAGQKMFDHAENNPDLLIHIGEITGDYFSIRNAGKQIWRISEDGEIRDTFRKLRFIFEMPEEKFFEHYIIGSNNDVELDGYLKSCQNHVNELYAKIPDIPFSNIWIASKIAHLIPDYSTIHFGILNSLRSWNFFELPKSVVSASNVGGFGIDGGLSALIGASLANDNKLYFGVIGDLAFFYDMNSLGNRHVGNNLRILLVNNGKGVEFRHNSHLGSMFGDDADQFIAAGGHFGNKSPVLVKHYAEDLGFQYLSAGGKDEFEQVYEQFLVPKITERPILLEVFTESADESLALDILTSLEENIGLRAGQKAKQVAKQILGDSAFNALKKFVK